MVSDRRRSGGARWRGHARWVLGAGLVVLGIVGDGRPAFACSCDVPPTVEEAMADHAAIFVGQVVDTWERNGGAPDSELVARVEVSEVFQSDVHETVEVRTAADGAMCGYGLQTGERHLLYSGLGSDGRYTVHACDRSAPVEAAGEDLAVLGGGGPPLPGAQEVAGDPFWQPILGWPWRAMLVLPGALLAVMLIVVGLRSGRRERGVGT